LIIEPLIKEEKNMDEARVVFKDEDLEVTRGEDGYWVILDTEMVHITDCDPLWQQVIVRLLENVQPQP
jgi:hypothetical protein